MELGPDAQRDRSSFLPGTAFGRYAQVAVMNSLVGGVARLPSWQSKGGQPRTTHNYKFFRKSNSESFARKRRAGILGSCSRDNAFSFMARSASTY